MSTKQRAVISGVVALALGLGRIPSAEAQDGLVSFGPAVEVDGLCTYSPVPFAAGGQVFVVWRNDRAFARTGPSLDQLGPAVPLSAGGVTGEVAAKPVPGGIAVAYVRHLDPQTAQVFLQRFGSNLVAGAPAVLVGQALPGSSPALLAEADGAVVVAYYGTGGTVQARRYSAADAPLTPVIDVDPLVGNDQPRLIRLIEGDDGFLVAWAAGISPTSPALWVRAFGWDGAPAGASQQIFNGTLADFDLARTLDPYLLAAPESNGVFGWRIDANGVPTTTKGLLAPADHPHHVRLAAGSDAIWLGFLDDAGLLASRIEYPSLTVFFDPQRVVPHPADGQQYFAASNIGPSPEGFIAAWQVANAFTVTAPCTDAVEIDAQVFGPPRSVVDVPSSSPAGRLALAALLTAAALLALRRR